ncbi:protein S100-P-like [Leptodactylus fuscus]|uniref:protein S100-P-like n=1 Tax=Leptodactylus fuscus TaxID=238119 RepID=UPI003F4EB209
MTQLETAIASLIYIFDKYSQTEGKKDTLTKGELKTLMEKELPGIMGKAKGKDDCDKLMKDLDDNGDAEVDFKEYVIFISAITCVVHSKCPSKPKK